MICTHTYNTHALYYSIPDNTDPRERMIAIARYYCSAFHAARKVQYMPLCIYTCTYAHYSVYIYLLHVCTQRNCSQLILCVSVLSHIYTLTYVRYLLHTYIYIYTIYCIYMYIQLYVVTLYIHVYRVLLLRSRIIQSWERHSNVTGIYLMAIGIHLMKMPRSLSLSHLGTDTNKHALYISFYIHIHTRTHTHTHAQLTLCYMYAPINIFVHFKTSCCMNH